MAATRCLALDAWRPYDHGCHINPPTTRGTCLSCKWRSVNKPEKSVVGKRCKARVVRQAQMQIWLQVLCHVELRSLCIFDLEHLLSLWVRDIPPVPHHPTVVCDTAAEQQPGCRHAATMIEFPDQSKELNRAGCRTLSDNAYKVRQQQGPSTLERHVASWCHAQSPCDKA
jgi:hypothetical protein